MTVKLRKSKFKEEYISILAPHKKENNFQQACTLKRIISNSVKVNKYSHEEIHFSRQSLLTIAKIWKSFQYKYCVEEYDWEIQYFFREKKVFPHKDNMYQTFE